MSTTYVVQHNEGLCPASINIADSEEDTLAHDGGQDLLDEEGKEDAGNSSQDEVVDQEDLLELEFVLLAHVFSTSQDDDVVNEDENSRLLQCGHGRDTGLETKLAGWVADAQLESLVKDGP